MNGEELDGQALAACNYTKRARRLDHFRLIAALRAKDGYGRMIDLILGALESSGSQSLDAKKNGQPR